MYSKIQKCIVEMCIHSICWWYKWSVGISSDSTAGCEIWRDVETVVLLPLECLTWHPAHAHKRDRWGEMASFCLLIFEEKRKWENEFAQVIWCMFWVLHSNRATTEKKTDPRKLEMYPVWPNWGLLLADYDHDFVLSINYLFGEGIASVCVGGNLPKWMEEGKFVGIQILRTAKYIRFLLFHCTRMQCQKNIHSLNFENIWRKTPED